MMIGPGGFAISIVPLLICCPSFSFIVGVAKESKTTKLGCEKYFLEGHVLSQHRLS
jgi:hypothetical protein